jgi:two-component system, sensor histidine kinase and response regulator
MSDSALKEPEADVVELDALKRRCLGNVELVARVLKKFANQLDSDLAELAKALAGGDAEAFAMVAHRIKGMSANVEARDLSRHAAAAEQCALDHDLSELPLCLDRMRQERARIAKSLQRVNIHS